VGWNRTVKLSVGPKFTGEMESLVFPPISSCLIKPCSMVRSTIGKSLRIDRIPLATDSINHSMPSPAFVHELGRRNIPINYGVEDLRQDLSSLGEVCSSD